MTTAVQYSINERPCHSCHITISTSPGPMYWPGSCHNQCEMGDAAPQLDRGRPCPLGVAMLSCALPVACACSLVATCMHRHSCGHTATHTCSAFGLRCKGGGGTYCAGPIASRCRADSSTSNSRSTLRWRRAVYRAALRAARCRLAVAFLVEAKHRYNTSHHLQSLHGCRVCVWGGGGGGGRRTCR